MNDLVEHKEQQTAIATAPTMPDFLAVISNAASDPNVDPAKMMALLDVQERMMTKQAEIEYTIAFNAMQKELSEIRIKKNGAIEVNGNVRSKYATYEDISKVVSPLFSKYGFSISFSNVDAGGKFMIKGVLAHEKGHSTNTIVPMAIENNPKVMNSQQSIGSAISYAQRYILKMLLNLVFEGEDDDGAKSGHVAMTDEQAETLKNLVRETGTDVRKFLDTMFTGVHSIDEISARDYNRAYNALNTRKMQMQKAAT